MELRQYQIENAKKLTEIIQQYKLAYFSAEVRTGKTLTALEVAKDYNNVLFVTKKKAIASIENDYKNFGYKFKLLVTNFEQIKNVKDNFDFIIIDEAHSLGAYPKPSQRTIFLKKLCIAKPILYLSGTPTPESYSQLYHQFYVSSYSPFAQYFNFYKWANIFVTKQIKYLYNREINDYSNAKIELIEKQVNHLFLSFSQVDAGFTEFVKEEILFCKMPDDILNLINRLKKDKIVLYADKEILGDTAVKEMSKVHQLSSGTVKYEDETFAIISDAKARFIKEKFANKKIAIYYKFIAEKEMLKIVFPNYTESPEQFNESENLVFISQFVSGREGINLSSADALIFINIDFSSLSYIQSKARIQTKDRVKDAKLYFIFSDCGIEKQIYKSVIKKQDYTLFYYKKTRNEIGIRDTSENNKEIYQTRLFCD